MIEPERTREIITQFAAASGISEAEAFRIYQRGLASFQKSSKKFNAGFQKTVRRFISSVRRQRRLASRSYDQLGHVPSDSGLPPVEEDEPARDK